MNEIKKFSRQNKSLIIAITLIIGLLFVLPLVLVKNSEILKKSAVIDGENELKSQVLVYGKDYHLHYKKEQEIKNKMEKRAEILEKKREEEKQMQLPPQNAQEIIEEIKEQIKEEVPQQQDVESKGEDPVDKNSSENVEESKNPEDTDTQENQNNESKDNNSENKKEPDQGDKPSDGGSSEGKDKPSPGKDNPPVDQDNFDNMDNIKHWEGDPSKPPPANVDKDMITPWDPKITTNLRNRSNYAGCVANFRIEYKKYNGSYFKFPGKLRVYLNGSEVYGDVEQRDPGGEYGYGKARNYNLDLKEGKNYVVIIAKDEDGFYSEQRFIIYGKKDQKPKEDEYVTFQFSFDLSNIGKGVPIPRQTFKVRKGTVVSKAVVDILTSRGYTVRYDGVTDAAGFYLWGLEKPGITSGWSLTQAQIDLLKGASSLNWDYDNNKIQDISPDKLYHKDIARWSGYMWYLNGSDVNYGLSQTALQDGDDIYFWWTNDLGRDLPGTHN